MRIIMFLVNSESIPGIKVINHKIVNAGGSYNEWKTFLKKETKGYDIAFFQYQREDHIPLEAIDNIPKETIKIAWTGDVRINIFDWQIELAKHVDIMSFVSGSTVKQMKRHKKASYYFDIWYDDDTFFPTDVKKDINVVFMVNNYRQFPLSDYRQEVANFVKLKLRGKLFGQGWSGFEDGEINNDLPRQREIYNRSKIAINISNFEHEQYSSDRILRAMGSGCFVLSHWYPQMPFENNKHLALFKDLTDLEQKVNYFLKNETQRETIARAGQQFVKKHWAKKQTKNRIENLVKTYAWSNNS